MRSHYFFTAHGRLHDSFQIAIRIPHLRTRHAPERALGPECILILVDVYDLISPKVDRIRAEPPGAVKVIWIKNLIGDRLPTTRRSSSENAGPWLTDSTKPLFRFGNKLLEDSIAIGPEIG